MRINLTKKELINSVYMQLGFSKQIAESLIDDFFKSIIENLISENEIKISNFGTFFIKRKKRKSRKKPENKKKKK